MKVLVACEFSGIVRDAFIKKGHDTMSCDLLPSESDFGEHYQGDLYDIINNKWDMIIAFPPCTYLCNSGVRWLKDNQQRQEKMLQACAFFNVILNAKPEKIVVENPIQHCHARKYIRKYDQIIQPWQFGHGETKATCLWVKGLPKLKPTNIVEGRESRIHKMPPSKNRGKLRSVTYLGIANAMANQWG